MSKNYKFQGFSGDIFIFFNYNGQNPIFHMNKKYE